MTDRDQAPPGDRRPHVGRAELDAVFGETLPRATSDEARDADPGFGDRWWREQRPPHHG